MDNLQGLDKLKMFKLDEKPPKLTPEGIRSLLQQSLKLAEDIDPKIFLKTLVVSKKLLNVTRRYPVYTLIVRPERNGDFSVSFTKEIDLSDFWLFWFLERTAKLSGCFYNRAFGLIKLLAPKHFYLDLERVEESSEALGQYEALFGLARNGKIGLRFPTLYWRSRGSAKLNYEPILNRLVPYLSFLECEFNVLKDADVVSTLDLDYFISHSCRNKDDFKALLRYNIRKITVDCFRIDDIDRITKFDLEQVQANSAIQSLEIRCFMGSYKSLGGFFDLLKHHCPHLRSLRLALGFYDDNLCPKFGHMHIDEVLKKLPAIHEKLKSLQDHVPSSLSSLVIYAKSNLRISPNSTFDRNWPEKLKHHEGFKSINRIDNRDFDRVVFISKYGFFTLTHKVEIRLENEIVVEDESDSDDSSDGY